MPLDAFNLEELEAAILSAPPSQIAPLPEVAQVPASPATPAVPQIISEAQWLEQWHLLHDMGGGMVQMRTGAPCPLGEQARGEGGRVAGEACYALMASNPTLARLVLGTQSTFFGQLAAIGMHGFSCVQIIKASATQPRLVPQPTQPQQSAPQERGTIIEDDE